MQMFRSELKRTDHEINPCTCAIARLPGILVVCPQVAAVLVCGVDPVGCAGLFLLLNLLRKAQTLSAHTPKILEVQTSPPFFGGGKLAPPILVWGLHPKNGGDHAKVEELSKTFCLEHILICNFQPTLHLPATISFFTLCFG